MDILETVERGIKAADAVVEIGRSVKGLPIYAAHCGKSGGGDIIITAAIHARECYTALAVLEQIRYAKEHRPSGGVWFVPLVNPDGALFFESGLKGTELTRFGLDGFLKANLDKRRQWKANAAGVDLNCNFDANFGTGDKQSKLGPAPHGYVGKKPLSEPESAALARFTYAVRPLLTVSYHSMGGEIYWEFFQKGRERWRDLSLARAIARRIGVKRVDGDLDSAGGYKDMCVQKLHIPAFTVELVSNGRHPLDADAYESDIKRNAALPGFLWELLSSKA